MSRPTTYNTSNYRLAVSPTPDMTYSCAAPNTPGIDVGLDATQYRRLENTISLGETKSTDYVLEVGTGWGSFTMEVVMRARGKVMSLTLSGAESAGGERNCGGGNGRWCYGVA